MRIEVSFPAFARWFGPPYLLMRDLQTLSAFIAIEKLCEIPGLVGVDPDDYPGLTPWFFERVADVADGRLSRRHCEPVQCAPLFPC